MKLKYLSISLITSIFVLSSISFVHAQTFAKNLYFGMRGDTQVQQLQEFLASQNLYSGPITGNFYFLTLGAVKAFQNQQGVTPAAGYFGPMTMAAANKIADAEVGASNAEAISETGTSTPPESQSSTAQLQLEALIQQVALLQQQLAAQQSSTQAVQNLQAQVQQQTQTIQQQSQTLQQIQQNTKPSTIINPPPSQQNSTPTQNSISTGTPPQAGNIQIIGGGSIYGVDTSTLYETSEPIKISFLVSDTSGNSVGNTSVIIATDDTNQNQTLTGGMIDNYTCVGACGAPGSNPHDDYYGKYIYTYTYIPKTDGQHFITLSALGATQAITLNSATPIISIISDSGGPPPGDIQSGSIQQPLAAFEFIDAPNGDGGRITSLTIHDAVSPSSAPPLANLTLYNGSYGVGTADSVASTSDGYVYTFNSPQVAFGTQNSISINLKGDVPSDGAEIGSIHVFSVTGFSGNSGYNRPLVGNINHAAGNQQTVMASSTNQ
jgi:hypothetical protein